jgi:hypothetical protein
VLRSLASNYIAAQRAGTELRTQLAAIERERTRVLDAAGRTEYGGPSDRELAEIERVRRTLARSSAASVEELRALEAVIAALASDALDVLSEQPAPAPATGAARVRAAEFFPVSSRDAVHRGGWSPPPTPPSGTDLGPDHGRLQ